MNGDRLKFGTDGYWAWNPGGWARQAWVAWGTLLGALTHPPVHPGSPINATGVFQFVLTGANRQELRVQLRQLRNADLGQQFRATE